MSDSLAGKILEANAKLLAEGDRDAIGEFFHEDYAWHGTEADFSGDLGPVHRFLGMVHEAFPDIEVEVEILVESGDRIAWVRTVRGKQTGAFMGFPASNRDVVWRDMVTSRFEDGKIAEEWAVSDLAERLLLARKG